MLPLLMPEVELSLRTAVVRRNERRHRWLRGGAISAALLVGLGGGATAIAVTSRSDAPTSPTSPAQIAPVATGQSKPLSREARERYYAERASALPYGDPAPDFAPFRRPATAEDALPAAAFPGTHVGTVDRSGSRLVLRSQLGEVRITPTDREVCLSSTFTGGGPGGGGYTDTCAPIARARRVGVLSFVQCFDPTRPQLRFVTAAVPDGVTTIRLRRRGAVQAQAEVRENAAQIKTDEPFDTVELSSGETQGVPPVTC